MRGISFWLATVIAAAVGAMAVVGGKTLVGGLLLAMLVAAGVAALLWRQSVRTVPRPGPISWPRVLAAGGLVCYLLSTLTFRGRSASAIASNPLDSAGFLRVVFLAGAAVFALLAVTVSAATGLRGMRLEPPARVYLLYIALSSAGVVVAVQPAYSLFAVTDFVILFFVFVAAVRAYQGDGRAIIRVILGFMGVLVGTVILGVVLAPSRALVSSPGSPIPVRLAGVFPDISFNSLGEFGLFFFAAGLVGLRPRRTFLVVGLALVLLSQYRTGYIGVAIMLLVYLFSQSRASRTLLASALGGCILLLSRTAEFQSVWARGSSSEVVGSLSGRKDYWQAGLEAVKRSPIVGLGLRSGARFEVLIARADVTTSTVHNTWVEALVGVGVLGLATLMVAFFWSFVRAIRQRRADNGLLALLVLIAIAVRSVTGTTIELAGVTALVFLAAVTLSEMPSRRLRRRDEPLTCVTSQRPISAVQVPQRGSEAP